MDYDTVNKAFRESTPVLSEFICNKLKEQDSNDWWKKHVLNNLSDISKKKLPKEGSYEECKESLDFRNCLIVMISNWQTIFNKIKELDDHLNYVHELLEIGNKYIAHPTEKSEKSWNKNNIGERALDTLYRFISPINSEIANQILNIKNNSSDKNPNSKQTQEIRKRKETIMENVKKNSKNREFITAITKTIKINTKNKNIIIIENDNTTNTIGYVNIKVNELRKREIKDRNTDELKKNYSAYKSNKSLLELYEDVSNSGIEVIINELNKYLNINYIHYSRKNNRWYLKKHHNPGEYINLFFNDKQLQYLS